MSFFKDFKEDLNQAVNELMPEEEATVTETVAAVEEEPEVIEDSPTASENYSDLFASFESSDEETSVEPDEEEEYEEIVEEVIEEVEVEDDGEVEYEEVIEEVIEEVEEDEEVEEIEVEEEVEEEEEEVASYADTMSALSASVEEVSEPAYSGPINTVTSPIFGESEPKSSPINTIWDDKKTAATGVIIEGMAVKGDVISQGSLDVLGVIEGNLQVMGKLNISGKVEGDSEAEEIFVNGAKIVGEIHSNTSVKVAQGSVIKGNIKAAAAVFAGAVKGDIDVQGPVILDSTAVIIGNIKSKSIQINNGAIIEGSCSQCYSDVTPSTYFDEEN